MVEIRDVTLPCGHVKKKLMCHQMHNLASIKCDASTIVTTSENFGAWLRATKNLRRNVNKAGKTENMVLSSVVKSVVFVWLKSAT
jgi:hypothetical protein